MNPFLQQLTHLTTLAKVPGWRAYAAARALELDADPSGLWLGISGALMQAVPGLEKAMEFARQRVEKRR